MTLVGRATCFFSNFKHAKSYMRNVLFLIKILYNFLWQPGASYVWRLYAGAVHCMENSCFAGCGESLGPHTVYFAHIWLVVWILSYGSLEDA